MLTPKVGAVEYLEDKAELVKREIEERWRVAEHARRAYRAATARPGVGSAQRLADAERMMGEFYGAYDMAHRMGYLIDWDERRENVVRVRVDPALAKALGGE